METLKHAAHHLNKFYSIQVLYMAYTPGILKILYPLCIVSTCVMYPWIQAKTPEICKIPGILWSAIYGIYGPFAIKREETARKKIFELMPILDIFQPKNHIWHINVTLIFFGSIPPFYCKGPICVDIYNWAFFRVTDHLISATVICYLPPLHST